MRGINNIKLKSLKQTQAFYLWELRKKDLTESERSKFLLALKSIEKIIKEKERSGEREGSRERERDKRFIPYTYKKGGFKSG